MHTTYNESAYRASWSKDGSIAKEEQGEPHLFFSAALAEAQRKTTHNRSVTVLYCDAGECCAENAGKWFLKQIVK
jgi:hypothetical protein